MSMMGIEQVMLDDWLMDLFVDDLPLAAIMDDRWAQGLAPAGMAYPLGVYQLQVPDDVRGLGTVRIMSNLQYLVKVLVQADYWSTNQRMAVARIDAILHGVINQPVPGGSVLSVVRDSPYSLVEPLEGKQVRHLGGLYTFQVQAS